MSSYRSMLLAMLAGLALCFSVQAEILKVEPSLELEGEGVVDAVDIGTRLVVINDVVFLLSRELIVHDPSGRGSDFAVQQGRNVKFRIDPRTVRENRQTILEVWLVKAGDPR